MLFQLAHDDPKLLSDARTGIFLGFAKTFKNILYYDLESETVRTAQHVVFDEAMVDHPDPPPNARLLALSSPSDNVPVSIKHAITFKDLDFCFSPFTNTSLMTIHVDYDSEFPFGFDVSTCDILKHAFISVVHRSPISRLSLRSFKQKYLGSYIVSLHDHQVFYPRDVDAIFNSLRTLAHPPTEVNLIWLLSVAPMLLTMRVISLHCISDVSIHRVSSICPPDFPLLLVSRLVTSPMTDAERLLPKLTRS
jgi:hypothetical protein